MASGRVKWFNSAKGFGFIEKLSRSGGGAASPRNEVFVHYSSIAGEGYRALLEGQEVEFDEYESEKGRIARNVVLKES